MRSWLVVMAVVGLSSVAQAQEKGKPDKASADFKAWADKMTDAMGKGDVEYMKGAISENVWGGAWGTDDAGRPISHASKAEGVKHMEEMTAMMKAMGAKMTFAPKRSECRASGQLGVCFQEGDITITSEKMPPMTMSMRETNVAMKEKGGWKWVHHHQSVAKWPEMPAKSMAMTAKTAKWMDVPGMPSLKMSPVLSNPVNGSGAALVKVGPEGMKNARHIHPFATAYLIVEGSMTTAVDGKDTEYGPGNVLYRAPKEPHTSTAKPGTVFLVVMDGPMASVFVDDKGNPLPQQPGAPPQK